MNKRKSVVITNLHKFRDGKLKVYKQSSTKNWMCKFFAEGKYKVSSLGTTNFNSAKESAQDWYDQLRFNQKQGINVHGKKFKDILPAFDAYQKNKVKSGELSNQLYKDYKGKIESKINKYFGEYYVHQIQLEEINEYKENRVANDGVSYNTITHDYVPMRALFKYCKIHKFIKDIPEFPEKSKKEKPNPRPWFSADEWLKLKTLSRKRCKSGRSTRIRHDREQLHDFMIWIVSCGTRVAETLRITFDDVKVHKKTNGEKELRMNINGKTGYRPVRGMIGSVRAYERICKRFPNHKKSDYLFPNNHKDGLHELLLAANMKKDKNGKDRNAKSFRSTFIMYRLIAKQPIKQVATNCGTSSNVIDSFYAKFIDVNMFDESFTDLPSEME